MAIVFGIDHGNGNIKTANFEFPCGLVSYEEKPRLTFEQDVIEYKNRYYMLSEKRLKPKQDKTQGEEYFILTLFGLAKEAKENGWNLNGKDVVIAGGLPPAEYNANVEKFTEYFKSHGKYGVRFSLNGKEVNFYISDVYMFAQDYAAAAIKKQEFLKKNPRVFCVDIGEGTTDLVVMKKGTPDLKDCASIKKGIFDLKSQIINEAMQNYGRVLDEEIVECILRGEEMVIEESIIELCKKVKQQWAVNITDELLPMVKDFRNAPTIFVGGGAVLLQKEILQAVTFNQVEFIDDIKANAIGYQVIGQGIYDLKKKGESA